VDNKYLPLHNSLVGAGDTGPPAIAITKSSTRANPARGNQAAWRLLIAVDCRYR
jgi:hypothetical protein